MEDTVISVYNISKSFKLYQDRSVNLKERALFRKRNKYKVHEVLKGISFDVNRGEAIALIGENGCGKSTTLKMLSRIMVPDSGSIEIKGRVSALIELGAGFHPDMTGRENIYINAAIFGLSRKEIDERLQDIIDFSELGEFIDSPVRTYSSGMYMRLAFSVAINVDADVLLVDEILAVGDASFQAKCFNKMREIKAKGTTIVIVSHSLGQIEQICDRSYWIRDGRIERSGNPLSVHKAYLEYMGENNRISAPTDEQETAPENVGSDPDSEAEIDYGEKRWGNKDIVIQKIRLLDESGSECRNFVSGALLKVELHYRVNKPVDNANFGVGFFRNDGVHCYGTNTTIDGLNTGCIRKNGVCTFIAYKCPLLCGEYRLDVAVSNQEGFDCDYIQDAVQFRVTAQLAEIGIMKFDHSWQY